MKEVSSEIAKQWLTKENNKMELAEAAKRCNGKTLNVIAVNSEGR